MIDEFLDIVWVRYGILGLLVLALIYALVKLYMNSRKDTSDHFKTINLVLEKHEKERETWQQLIREQQKETLIMMNHINTGQKEMITMMRMTMKDYKESQ